LVRHYLHIINGKGTVLLDPLKKQIIVKKNNDIAQVRNDGFNHNPLLKNLTRFFHNPEKFLIERAYSREGNGLERGGKPANT